MSIIKTIDFKRKTLYIGRKNKTVGNYIQLSLDIGFSGVKAFSPIAVYCFPAYARRVDAAGILSLSSPSPSDILYKNLDTGEMWLVGSLAVDLSNAGEAVENISTLCCRNRYDSPMYQVLTNVGLGIGMLGNNISEGLTDLKLPIHIETGLPPEYISDKEYLATALSGRRHFAIKTTLTGKGNKWVEFDLNVLPENVDVIEQPMGTYFSTIYDNDGRKVSGADEILRSRTLIFDGGFGTLDVFSFKKIAIESKGTFEDLGMKRVFMETCDKIKDIYGTALTPLSLEQYLSTGEFRFYDKKSTTTANVNFTDLLEDASEKVMNEAITRIKGMFNDLIYHDNLVVTGGTGDAWFDGIAEHFKNMSTLNVVKGTLNDSLPAIFSNVRGYYYYQLNLLRRR